MNKNVPKIGRNIAFSVKFHKTAKLIVIWYVLYTEMGTNIPIWWYVWHSQILSRIVQQLSTPPPLNQRDTFFQWGAVFIIVLWQMKVVLNVITKSQFPKSLGPEFTSIPCSGSGSGIHNKFDKMVRQLLNLLTSGQLTWAYLKSALVLLYFTLFYSEAMMSLFWYS